MKIKVSSLAAGVLLLYLFMLMLTPAPFIFLPMGLSPDRLLLLAGTLLVLSLGALRFLIFGVERSQLLHSLSLVVPVLGIFMVGSLSLITSSAVTEPLEILKQLFLQCITLISVIYLTNKVCVSGSPASLAKKLILLVSLASAMGVAFTLAGVTPLDVMRSLGVTTTSEFAERLLGLSEVRFLGLARSQGFFTHPLEYGSTLVMVYALARLRPGVLRPWYVRQVVFIVLLCGVFFSGSRSAWLGIVLVEVLVRYLNFNRTQKWFVIAGGASLVFALLLLLNSDLIAVWFTDVRWSTDPLSQSLAGRLADYQIVLAAVQNPLGVGYTNWESYAVSHSFSFENWYIDNDYLRLLVETGFLGLVAYLFFVFRGLMPLPYEPLKRDHSAVFLLTLVYAWHAFAYDAFAFQVFVIVSAILLTIALSGRGSFN